MVLEKRIELLKGLRSVIENLSNEDLESLGSRSASENRWFTTASVHKSLEGITRMLSDEQLELFAAAHQGILLDKSVGLVLAGNIPAVGFHDLVVAVLTGCGVKVKPSHQDSVLIKFLIQELRAIAGEAVNIEVVEKLQLDEVDGVIATGSNNSARYFEQYFAAVPNVIRKNRTSIAVVSGEESAEELDALVEDMLTYYGLGCRNVTKLMIPVGYDLVPLLARVESRNDMLDHTKYLHNYDYNKSIFLVNGDQHLDSGNALFKESADLFSPISVTYYEFYKDENTLTERLKETQDEIQCVVGGQDGLVKFGEAQSPGILDYADGVDIVSFLKSL